MVSEKSSRVVEVILSAIRPVQLLAGKVLGVGLLGLLQVGLIAFVGLAIAVPSGAIGLPDSTAETVGLVFVYFVLGYALYACAFAVAGSIVSSQEDSQTTTTHHPISSRTCTFLASRSTFKSNFLFQKSPWLLGVPG